MCLSLDRKGQSRRAKFPKTVCVIGFLSFLRLHALGKKNPKTEGRVWPREHKGACLLSPKTIFSSVHPTRTRAPPPADIICVTCHVESVHKVCVQIRFIWDVAHADARGTGSSVCRRARA